jgi:hypothetical protein
MKLDVTIIVEVSMITFLKIWIREKSQEWLDAKDVSIKASGSVYTYDRYDPKYGLHK